MISLRERSKFVHVFISFRYFSSIKRPYFKPFQFEVTKNISNYQSVRLLSTKDVFFKDIGDLASQVPSPPLCSGPKQTLAEMLASGVSVLEDLELWTWWKPSCWLRTVLIRLSLIFVPIKMQRFAAKQKEFQPQIEKFRDRLMECKKEGDHMLVHQIMMEQNDFLKKNGISPVKYFPLVSANALIFMSQFFALKGLATSKYPGFQDGGILWFKDLSVGDPYWILPATSAFTLHFALRSGIDVGTLDTFSPLVRQVVLYGFPAIVLVFALQFPSALCVYWVTNNVLSMIISSTFKKEPVRRLLNLPKTVDRIKPKESDFSKLYKEWKVKANHEMSSRKNTRQEDYENFQKAGRGKPILLVFIKIKINLITIIVRR
ncbi:hypothetical protein Mgra_00001481 [Meloidogyne graminicola]|uniref:Membrane insertase YidC/Oxa/ALB C-terminal domain-containing protein n=1 Tax=Meloidogyne graminicola TaxID=189291 RepID=A0A8T0A0Z0_9BILA|nr:hypothetical protein Mgra_00001481 [Meloidogyne graminicola]